MFIKGWPDRWCDDKLVHKQECLGVSVPHFTWTGSADTVLPFTTYLGQMLRIVSSALTFFPGP